MTFIPILAIIVPCYNEEDILPKSSDMLGSLLKSMIDSESISKESFLCFVDDGSRDGTWPIIDKAAKTGTFIRGIRLSTNFGHQGALLAGLEGCSSQADCFITIDADLQDDLNVIPEMVRRYAEGYQIVYGVRKKRDSDSFFKRTTALAFYKLMKALGVSIKYNHADFRLIGKKVLLELERFQEVNLFLRGIFPLMGFRNCEVHYNRSERSHGETKYPLRKMLSFAFDGISSFSIKPLRLITLTGFVVFIISLAASGYALWGFFSGRTIPGWVSTVVPFYFLGGLQILCIGIIGEYLGKIYKEVKRRPRFIIDCKSGFRPDE